MALPGNTVRVGLIGLGKMGRIRARVLAARGDVALVAAHDPAPEAFLEEFPGTPLVAHAESVLSSEADAVFIATPNKYTPDLVVAALHAGKHVFCEKPPGRNVVDIERIIAAEQANPRCRLKFGFNHRYHAGIQEAKRIVDSGRLGNLMWARAVYGKSGGRGFEREWRSDPDLVGGGILLDQGIHMLDLLAWFLGPFEEVKGMVSSSYWKIGVEDNAFALLRDAHGRIAQLHSSSTQWKHRFTLELYLTEGYLSVNGILSSTRSYGDETITVARRRFAPGMPHGNPREETIYFDNDPSWELEIDDFIRCLRDEAPVTLGNSQQAHEAMRLVFAIYDSDPRS